MTTEQPSPEKEHSAAKAVLSDPINFSVVLSKFRAIAAEMTLVIEKSTRSPILALARDFSCVIYDARGRQICMLDPIPIHTAMAHLIVESFIGRFGDDIRDGDIYMSNYAHRGNTHIGDLTTAAPVFIDGELTFWVVARGHQMDCGAYVPTSLPIWAQDVWQEGFQIPPVRLYDRHVKCDDVWTLYLANVRFPELLEGDLMAQAGSCTTGRRRLEELSKEYSRDGILEIVDEIIDYSDQRSDEDFRAMPDGEFEGVSWIDSDATEREHIEIRAKVTLKGNGARVDFTGGPQGMAAVNGTQATAEGSGAIPLLLAVSPDIPRNHGVSKHIEVNVPKGTICNADYPAATATATTVPADAMQEAVNRALVQAIPDRVMAGTARTGGQFQFGGVDPDSGEPWTCIFLNGAGGGGATAFSDGWPLIAGLAPLGGQKVMATEQTELLHPGVLVERLEIEPESMGFGQHNGGPGLRSVVRHVDDSLLVHTWGDGFTNPPHGALGGTPGAGGGYYVEHADGGRTFYPVCTQAYVAPGEKWVSVSSGGGGYGHPFDREVEAVQRDVHDELYSRQTAEDVFGVVLADDEQLTVDVAATERARADRPGSVPAYTPTEPNAGRWQQKQLRPGDDVVRPGEQRPETAG